MIIQAYAVLFPIEAAVARLPLLAERIAESGKCKGDLEWLIVGRRATQAVRGESPLGRTQIVPEDVLSGIIASTAP